MDSLFFDEKTIIEFINQYNNKFNNKIDLSSHEFVDTVYWIILKTLNLDVVTNERSPAHSYAQYLFNNNDKKTKTTVPIREIKSGREVGKFVNEILDSSGLDFEDWQDKEAFKYLLVELVNNAVDHGKSKAVACAQKFPKNSWMEITVSDTGLGFLKTIQNRYPEIKTYDMAIKKALEKGVTGNQLRIYGDVTKNVGMGLYITSRIIKEVDGDMYIISGDKFYSLRDDKSVNLLSPWQGSLVILRFNLDNFQKNILNYGFELVKAMLLAEEGGVDIF